MNSFIQNKKKCRHYALNMCIVHSATYTVQSASHFGVGLGVCHVCLGLLSLSCLWLVFVLVCLFVGCWLGERCLGVSLFVICFVFVLFFWGVGNGGSRILLSMGFVYIMFCFSVVCSFCKLNHYKK